MPKNIFKHKVNLVKIDILNDEQDVFRDELLDLPYLLYEVESLQDGNKIVINKPGGKRNFGRLSREDFMVFIFFTDEEKLWLISHPEILEDLDEKYFFDSNETLELIDALHRVCLGEEPDDVLKDYQCFNLPGLPADTLLKVYKWIWGQEDCNYPTKQGRWLSMNAILEHFNLQ